MGAAIGSSLLDTKLVLLLTICLLAIIVFLTAQAMKYKNLYEKLRDDIESGGAEPPDDESREN